MTVSLFVLAILAAGYLGMLGTAVAGLVVPFLVLAAVSYAAGAALDRYWPRAADWLHLRLELGHGLQFLVHEIFVLVLGLRAGLPGWTIGWLLGCYVALQAIRSIFAAASAMVERRRRRPVEWRNLHLPSLELPSPPLARLTHKGARRILYLDLLPLCGVAAVEFGAPLAVLPTLATLAILLALTFCVVVLADRVQLLGYPHDDEVMRTVRDAVEELAPQVVAYHAGAEGSEHMLDVWLSTYEQLEQSTVIFVRERVHLHRIAPTSLPIVVLPRAADLEYFRLPSVKVALYSSNDSKNNHLIRLPGIKDVFVGHGDSDKGANFTPLSRLYDEIWVAGPAGRERYRRADVGVRDDQVREVGRPQLVEIRKSFSEPDLAARPTVLYAPTWEGADRILEYSSLASMGEAIVAGLFTMDPPVRVLFKPHPRTGRKVCAYAEALAEVSDLVRSAGGDHRVVDTTEGLYEAFNQADILISDISGVITDFLFSAKPYVVTNPRGDDPNEFRQAFPSSTGAYLLDPDCARLADFIGDALGADSLAGQRRRVAAYLLGDIHADPVRRFNDGVAELVARQLTEDAETGYAPGWYDGTENTTSLGAR